MKSTLGSADRRMRAPFFLGFLLLLVLGCGSGRGPTVDVNGKVTLNNQPFSEGRIWFTCPKTGAAFPGELGTDGTYSVRILDAQIGETYGVAIGGVEPKDEIAVDGSGNPAGVTPPPVPAKYFESTTSGLTATINSDDSQTFDFELKSDPRGTPRRLGRR